MRMTTCLLAAAALLLPTLAGCGGGSQEPAPAPSPVAERPKPVLLPLEMDEEVPPAVPVDPFAEVPEAVVALSDAWLLFEGAMGKAGPTLAHPGKEPVDGYRLWQFEAELDAYHKLTDAELQLPGLDPEFDWVSRNPLVFRSAPLVNSRAFNLFMEHLPGKYFGEQIFLLPTGGGELSVRHSAKARPEEDIPEPPPPEAPPEYPVEYPKDEIPEPPPPQQPPERPVEYPADEPTGPRPLEEMTKWQKNTVEMVPVYDRKKEVFGFRTVWAERTEEHQDTGFRIADLCDAEGWLTRQVESAEQRYAAMRRDQQGNLASAMDQVRELTRSRAALIELLDSRAVRLRSVVEERDALARQQHASQAQIRDLNALLNMARANAARLEGELMDASRAKDEMERRLRDMETDVDTLLVRVQHLEQLEQARRQQARLVEPRTGIWSRLAGRDSAPHA